MCCNFEQIKILLGSSINYKELFNWLSKNLLKL